MSTEERYVNTPLEREVYDALREQATENGRNLGRELSRIAAKALRRRTRKDGQE